MLGLGGIEQDPFVSFIGFKSKLGLVLSSWIAIAICGFTGYAEQGKTDLAAPSSNTIYTLEFAMNGASAAERYQMYNWYDVPMGQLTG